MKIGKFSTVEPFMYIAFQETSSSLKLEKRGVPSTGNYGDKKCF